MPDFFWGVDVGVHQSALGVRTDRAVAPAIARTLEHHHELDARGMWIRFGRLSRWIRHHRQLRPPTTVVLEFPIGRHPEPYLMATWGLMSACLGEWVACPILDLRPNEWKARAGLPGNAPKAVTLGAAVSETHLELSEHEADALMMATAAQNLYWKHAALHAE